MTEKKHMDKRSPDLRIHILSPSLSLSLSLARTFSIRQVPGLISQLFDPHGSSACPTHTFWYFFCPVGTLRVRAYIALNFRAGLRFLKVPQLVHVRKSRLRRQVLLGHRSRATKTLPSLVIGKGDFEHPVL